MDVPNTGPTGQTPSHEGSVPSIPVVRAWTISRTSDGGYRVQTPYASQLRPIVVKAFLAAATLFFVEYLRRPADPVFFLIGLASLAAMLAPILVVFSYREEWTLAPGRFTTCRGYLGLLRSREHSSGVFAIVTRKPPTGLWLSALHSLIGVTLATAGFLLLEPLTSSRPRHLERALPLFMLAMALIVYGTLTFAWPIVKWFHERSEHSRRRLQLALRSGERETVLIPSEFRLDGPTLDAFAAWLARETGWTVEPRA